MSLLRKDITQLFPHKDTEKTPGPNKVWPDFKSGPAEPVTKTEKLPNQFLEDLLKAAPALFL